jgi:predicted Zn-dependent protease
MKRVAAGGGVPTCKGMTAPSTLRFALLLTLVACTRNPATGERQLSIISRDQEIQLGEQGAQEIEATIGLVEDPELQRYVTGVGRRLAQRSEQPDLPWRFGVLDDPTPNAFALPGGKIYITRGMLVHMENEAQMASVLGHEVGHVTARHSAEQISKAALAQVGLGLGAIFAPGGEQLLPIASTGLSVLFLKFGRDDEYQADELGVRYAHRAEYDVRHMPGVFEMLDRVSRVEGGGRVPEWLSTHPNPENRIERIEERIAEIDTPVGGDVHRERFLRRLDGTVFGADPRDGYFSGDRFYHPELAFQFNVPSAWRRLNYPQAVVATSPDEDAIIQLTVAKDREPERALAEFGRQSGVTMGEPADLVQDLQSASATFEAETQDGALRGLVTYVAHEQHTFELLAVAPPERFGRHAEIFARIHGSFEPLTDPERLNVEAPKLEVVRVPETMTLTELYEQRGASIPLERIALLNQIEADTRLERGRLLKWVTGGTGGARETAER